MHRVADHLLAIRRNGYWEFDGLRIIFLELRRLFSNLPVGPPIEVFDDPHVVARGMVLEMAHGSGAKVKVIANPVRLSETPPDYRIGPPMLGEHTEEILGDLLGFDAEELAGLREKGVI